VRIRTEEKALVQHTEVLTNDAMSPLFLAAIEATEEAVYNSMLRATTTTGRGHTVEALPLEQTKEILRKHGPSSECCSPDALKKLPARVTLAVGVSYRDSEDCY